MNTPFVPALLESDRPVTLFSTGLLRISSFGDLYPSDGLAPALGTTIHPYSQLNLTKATIDSSGNTLSQSIPSVYLHLRWQMTITPARDST